MRGYLLLLALLVGLTGCLQPLPFDEAAWQETVARTKVADLYAPHRDAQGNFFNPWLKQPERGLGPMLRWWFSRSSVQADPIPPPAPWLQNDGAYLSRPNSPDSLTWVGHATYALQWSGQVVLTDPLFNSRALVVRRQQPPGIPISAVPAGAVVLLSHNHYDHLDLDSVRQLARRVSWLCPLGVGQWLREQGAEQVRELDWWQEVNLGGTIFTCLPTQHWSLRLGQGRNRSLWCAWMMERRGRKVLFGGDSGYFKGFAEFGRRWPGIELAILPVGAYEPRWFMHYAHMNIPEALRAFADTGARLMVPMQWGVLELGDEPASYPVVQLKQALANRPQLSQRVRILPVGGRLLLDQAG